MNPTASPIFLSKTDAEALRQCAGKRLLMTQVAASVFDQLAEEVKRAEIFEDDALPNDVVALGRAVEIEFVDDGDREIYSVVLPENVDKKTDAGVENISVLSALGLALLGVRVGDLVQWPLPNGRGFLQVSICRIVSAEK